MIGSKPGSSLNKVLPLLDIVVTARPSWARVKTILTSYVDLAGVDGVRLSLVGPAVSDKYGDITDLVPKNILTKSHSTLRVSDDLPSVALTCLDGAQALVHQWSQFRPDCALVVADRSETLGVSAAAALMQIPLIHLQGGETSGSIDGKIRDVNSKLADLHLTTNTTTEKYLRSIGENPESIFVVGCPSIDLVKKVMSEPFSKLENLGGVGASLDFGSTFGIVMFHPDTLESNQSYFWVKTLIDVVQTSELPWVWFWPNPDHGTNLVSKLIRTAREEGQLKNVRFLINTSPENFIALATKSAIIIGNSSFGIREASFIGLPALNLGTRQNGREKSLNVTDLEDINASLLLKEIKSKILIRYPSSHIYGDGSAGKLSAKIISEWNPKVKSK